MYLKCYYNANKGIASISEVEEALKRAGMSFVVDNDLGYPSVNFPPTASYEDWERVQSVLRDAGFETE